jgi:predicted metal-dependent phosphoesterase TrpH
MARTIKAITHIHTRRSWDGVMRPATLAERLHSEGIDMALVTDHDSFEGAREVAAAIADSDYDIRVPMAAEIRTDMGDLVVVLQDVEPPPVDAIKSWRNLVAATRDLGGIVWLPHPFRSHPEPRRLAEHADVIEVFNSRCSNQQNELARRLCAEVGAVPAFGSDAHLLREVPHVVVEYGDHASPIETLRTEPIPLRKKRAERTDKDLAEIVNGFKRKRPTLVGYFSLRYVGHMIQKQFGGTADRTG